MSSLAAAETEGLPVAAADLELPPMRVEAEKGPEERQALERSALKATVWTVIDYGSAQALRIVNSLALTWLLFPAAFGEMTLITTLIVGVALLSDIGLTPSVIQSKRGDDPAFLNTAWTLQVIRGGLLWLAASLLAWPASLFYHDRHLLTALPVLASGTVILGFNSTNLLTLSRHLGVRRLFLLDFSTQIVALLVTVLWAWRWPSVWALVFGSLVSNLYRMVLSHHPRVAPGIRNRFAWDRAALREILHFGKWIVLGTAFFFFASQADRLMLGKLVPLSVLGVYGIAFSLSDIPRSIINAFSSKVGYPFVAKIIDLPREEFRRQFLRYRLYALLLGALLLSVVVNWGGLVVVHLYKASYLDAAWMVPVLALGLWHTLLYTTTNPVLFSLGKSKYNAVGNAAYCAAILTGIPLGFHFYGLLGAVVAVAAGDLPLYIVTQFGATREGIRPLAQDLLLTLCFAAMLAGEFGLKHLLR